MNKLIEIYVKETAIKLWPLWTGFILVRPMNKVKDLIPSGRTERQETVS